MLKKYRQDSVSQIVESLKLSPYYIYRAYLQLQITYKNTRFGILWDPLSLVIVTTILSGLWSVILKVETFQSYFLYVLTGYAHWMLISSMVEQGIQAFDSVRHRIRDENRPLIGYVFEQIVIAYLKYLLIFPIVLIFLMAFGEFKLFYCFPLLIYILLQILIFGIGLAMLFGVISFYINDFGQIILSIMRLAFLLTPIVWTTDQLGKYEKYIWFNPFFGYLESIRSTMIQSTPMTVELFLLPTLISSVLLFLGIYVYGKLHSNIRRRSFEL